jgi:hypothetical protein
MVPATPVKAGIRLLLHSDSTDKPTAFQVTLFDDLVSDTQPQSHCRATRYQ